MGFRVCVESATVSYRQCDEYADRGYRECDAWRSECCDWWPCNWFCEIVSWFCTAWVWVSRVVCAAWSTITMVVCLVWSVIEFVLAPLGVLIELIRSIPIVGRLIDLILNLVTSIVWRLVRLPEMFGALTGTEPTLTVRLCVLVLRSGGSYPASPVDPSRAISREDVAAAVADAAVTWVAAANIHVALEHVAFVPEDAPQEAAFPGCGDAIAEESFGLAGSYYQLSAARFCPLGSLGRATAFNSWMIAVLVHGIGTPGRIGCAFGPLNDYFVLLGSNLDCLAHELGHKLALAHEGDRTNLMNPVCGGTRLEWWQRLWARNSKYASHF